MLFQDVLEQIKNKARKENFVKIFHTFEGIKWNEFNKLKLYKTIEPDTKNITPFIIINSFGIFLFSKSDLFINPSDIEDKYNEPNKQEDKIIYLYILLF